MLTRMNLGQSCEKRKSRLGFYYESEKILELSTPVALSCQAIVIIKRLFFRSMKVSSADVFFSFDGLWRKLVLHFFFGRPSVHLLACSLLEKEIERRKCRRTVVHFFFLPSWVAYPSTTLGTIMGSASLVLHIVYAYVVKFKQGCVQSRWREEERSRGRSVSAHTQCVHKKEWKRRKRRERGKIFSKKKS